MIAKTAWIMCERSLEIGSRIEAIVVFIFSWIDARINQTSTINQI